MTKDELVELLEYIKTDAKELIERVDLTLEAIDNNSRVNTKDLLLDVRIVDLVNYIHKEAQDLK